MLGQASSIDSQFRPIQTEGGAQYEKVRRPSSSASQHSVTSQDLIKLENKQREAQRWNEKQLTEIRKERADADLLIESRISKLEENQEKSIGLQEEMKEMLTKLIEEKGKRKEK